ncbi:MAG: serpin family protein [Candidatus Cloacimonetes bacterium]|nr:serpin family protein [Candidatus Cloacimonadota bacterium]
MKLKICLILVLIIPSLSIFADGISDSITDFGFDLLRQVKCDDKNIIISPYSVFSALSMTAEGADDETLLQMQNVLKLDKDASTACRLAELKEVLFLNAGKNIDLNIANALWLDKQFELKESFKQTIKNDFQAQLNQADFNEEAKTLQEINNWVASQTNDKIPEILTELEPLSKLVLLNAIYFKGEWKYKFKKSKTDKDKFHLNSRETTQVDMMHQTSKLNYYEDDLVQAVQMKYDESSYSLLVILPRSIDDMPEVLQKLDADYFRQINEWEYRRSTINISLPKFKIDYNRSLNEDLKTLGMSLAFSDAADFSRINGKKDLCIGQVMHRGFIEVDEKGTEAAAATAVTMKMMSAGPPKDPIDFTADHPFIFLLQENTHNLILFAGIVNNPR